MSSPQSKIPVLQHYMPLLKLVKSLKRPQQRVLMRYLTEDAQRALSSVVKAVVLSVNLPARKKQYLRKRVQKQKGVLRALSSKENLSRAERTKLLEQTGGLPIAALLSVAIPLITSAIQAATA